MAAENQSSMKMCTIKKELHFLKNSNFGIEK